MKALGFRGRGSGVGLVVSGLAWAGAPRPTVTGRRGAWGGAASRQCACRPGDQASAQGSCRPGKASRAEETAKGGQESHRESNKMEKRVWGSPLMSTSDTPAPSYFSVPICKGELVAFDLPASQGSRGGQIRQHLPQPGEHGP